MQELAANKEIVSLAQEYAKQQAYLAQLCIQLQQIPAPTGDEGARAAWVEAYFKRIGLDDVAQDDVHNVYSRLPGRSRAPALLVSAHTDTVFPIETDLAIREDRQHARIFGPGIGDNSAGVAGLLALAEQLHRVAVAKQTIPPVDIWFVANSGEEGLGDLCGMRAAVDRLHSQLGACLIIEGMGYGRIVHRALGSRRYRITVEAPGGHSWSDFGTASAIHILTQIGAAITQLQPPTDARTTYNIGRIWGGRSINTIAQNASFDLDIRSERPHTLQAMIDQALNVVVQFQTRGWQQRGVEIKIETIGNRPSGEIAESHPLVQAAIRSLASSGLHKYPDLRISSTDANVPLSRGIPAVCIGITEGGDAHRLEEWITTTVLPRGMQHLLFLTWWASLWLAGEI